MKNLDITGLDNAERLLNKIKFTTKVALAYRTLILTDKYYDPNGNQVYNREN
ncbi:MAG: hypothetical protein KTV77_02010 [Wolbachia endosymbiont of Fragariocoptes setiger]|nr:hypothetical protein [Wolbachia endosymbiont of Fragariocoptes setiger]